MDREVAVRHALELAKLAVQNSESKVECNKICAENLVEFVKTIAEGFESIDDTSTTIISF